MTEAPERIAVSGELLDGGTQRVHGRSISDRFVHDIAARNALGGPRRLEAARH